MVKAEVLEIVAANQPTPSYRATEIAVEHGHTVHYTPPYHPELQPIELIWAQLKQKIASSPAGSMQQLGEKINDGMTAMTSQTWVKAYRHVQKKEDMHLSAAEDDLLASGSDNDGSESEADDPVLYSIAL